MSEKASRVVGRLAYHAGRQELYKFRSLASADEREWVRQIIENSCVYFSRKDQLNDPFELETLFKFAGDPADPKFIGQLVQDSRRILANRNAGEREIQATIERIRADPTRLLIVGAPEALRGVARDYLGFSLSGTREHVLLWSHYANGHAGICLHFAVHERSYFGAAQEVGYNLNRPMLDFPMRKTPPDVIASHLFLHKGKPWEYEDEFRLIRYKDMELRDIGIMLDGPKAYFPPPLLTAITLGCRISDMHRENIIALAKKRRPSLRVDKACITDTYSLAFERIA